MLPNENATHNKDSWRISIAPMLGITNSNFRSFMRLLTKQAMLYTEMIHCKTLMLNPNYKKYL